MLAASGNTEKEQLFAARVSNQAMPKMGQAIISRFAWPQRPSTRYVAKPFAQARRQEQTCAASVRTPPCRMCLQAQAAKSALHGKWRA